MRIPRSRSCLHVHAGRCTDPGRRRPRLAGAARVLGGALASSLSLTTAFAQQPFDPARGIILRGTVVTMDVDGSILDNGNVLVRNGKIIATWAGPKAPKGTPIDGAIKIDLGSKVRIFPGMINLHNHSTYDMLELWPAPSSHLQPALGRPLGTEPYANRYQWNLMANNASDEFRRLVDNPHGFLTSPLGFDLGVEADKYSRIKAALGGETTFQGGGTDGPDNNVIRNAAGPNFGRNRVQADVAPLGGDLSPILAQMRAGTLDAWLIHAAEGVRDGQRRPGDTFSSRAEFAALAAAGVMTDNTVIIHGTGLEPEDFATMRAAPSVRTDGTGDGLGAKLVWSPLSNLLLYGQTALVYQALAAGVVVSLGTDWSPSGSRNLLDELKIADVALRDRRLLGADRNLIPRFRTAGKHGNALREAESALDEQLVEMVTTNPARTLRWSNEVGSIEAGKYADLLLVTAHDNGHDSPYRDLIDATERDVRLVLVNGEPIAGDVGVMATLKPQDNEVVVSPDGCFAKAIDITNPAFPKGTETFAELHTSLRDALASFGGDHPPAGGGPADNTNTYTYLQNNVLIPGAKFLTPEQFRDQLPFFVGLTSTGRLNIERVQLSPVLVEDDDFAFHLLGGEVFAHSGLIADATPPFGIYPANFNQIQPAGNPFAASAYRDRYFDFCGSHENK